jgi:hypothetical protein
MLGSIIDEFKKELYKPVYGLVFLSVLTFAFVWYLDLNLFLKKMSAISIVWVYFILLILNWKNYPFFTKLINFLTFLMVFLFTGSLLLIDLSQIFGIFLLVAGTASIFLMLIMISAYNLVTYSGALINKKNYLRNGFLKLLIFYLGLTITVITFFGISYISFDNLSLEFSEIKLNNTINDKMTNFDYFYYSSQVYFNFSFGELMPISPFFQLITLINIIISTLIHTIGLGVGISLALKPEISENF